MKGHPGDDLAADLAAIEDSFGVLADHEAFSCGRDERMEYLDRLASLAPRDWKPATLDTRHFPDSHAPFLIRGC